MTEFNKLGGVEPKQKDEIKRARDVDLITLPKEVPGTNCFNCRWIRDKKAHIGYCINHKVAQEVNQRMCCVLWSHKGEYRAFGQSLEKYQ